MLGKLENIYVRLHDVKIDSYVDVRVLDDLGALPIPATVATGLLVSAFASEADPIHAIVTGTVNAHVLDMPDVTIGNDPLTVHVDNPVNSVIVTSLPNVTVSNDSLTVHVDNTSLTVTGSVAVTGSVSSHNYVKEVASGNWSPALGRTPAQYKEVYNNTVHSTNVLTDTYGAVPLTAVGSTLNETGVNLSNYGAESVFVRGGIPGASYAFNTAVL